MVRLIAVVLVGTGAWMVSGLWPSYVYPGEAVGGAASSAGAGVAVLLVAQLLAPILKILAGVGLLARKRWSWPIAWVALATDVIALGISILRLHRFEEVSPPIFTEGASGGSLVQTVSAVPLYVIWLLSLVCLVLLSTKAVREEWKTQIGAA